MINDNKNRTITITVPDCEECQAEADKIMKLMKEGKSFAININRMGVVEAHIGVTTNEVEHKSKPKSTI